MARQGDAKECIIGVVMPCTNLILLYTATNRTTHRLIQDLEKLYPARNPAYSPLPEVRIRTGFEQMTYKEVKTKAVVSMITGLEDLMRSSGQDPRERYSQWLVDDATKGFGKKRVTSVIFDFKVKMGDDGGEDDGDSEMQSVASE